MRLFNRIIIPLEANSSASALLAVALRLAKNFHSEFILMPVSPHGTALTAKPSRPTRSRWIPWAPLDSWFEQLKQAGASAVSAVSGEGSPAPHLEAVALERNATLIILAAEEGDGSQSRAWFGTTTQKLARRLPTPLLVIRPDRPQTLTPILVSVDFSESSRRALHYALFTARALGSGLTVLHVIPEPLRHPLVESSVWSGGPGLAATDSIPWRTATLGQQLPDPTLANRAEDARLELDRFLAEFDLAGVECERLVTAGSPVSQTLSQARRLQVGLIVVGSSPESGLIRMATQSTGEALAEMSEIPVMILRSVPERLPVARKQKTSEQPVSKPHYL